MRRASVATVLIISLAGVLAVGITLGIIMFNSGSLRFWASKEWNVERTVTVRSTEKIGMDDALKLLAEAEAKFASVKDYECTYLREEFFEDGKGGGELKACENTMKLRHEPFSVRLKWEAPELKKGREIIYVAGQNDNKMLVRMGIRLPSQPLKASTEKKESRHTVDEAGIKNMLERFRSRWEVEKRLNLTVVELRDVEVKIKPTQGEVVRECKLVSTIHPVEHKEKFLGEGVQFYRTLLYFDKETGLPLQMEGYDWPKDETDKEGRLLERYTYLNVKTNVGSTDKDFKW